MKNALKWGGLAIVVASIVGVAAFFIRSGSGEASAPVTAPPVSTTTTLATAPETTQTTEVPDEETPATASGSRIFSIVPGESEARFILQEDLSGSRIDVVGTTTEVAGEISADPADLSTATVGTIVINVRTLSTGNSFRDRAIRGNILDSAQDEFEFSMFEPTAISGLPESVSVGESFTFTIEGDLTVRDVTSPVVFDVEANMTDADSVTGLATTTVTQSDFGISIQAPAQVANISEEIVLELDFVARA
ncbi:MAG: YceI family protein [Acidimicrobiia bacterium]|nr:YceI family protein [Acidimicrobiia bacterium]NNL48050.1 YceI family protein [Acidimicrobiia bacterium]